MLRRALLVGLLTLMIGLTPSLTANPGGEGNGEQDFTCGGSCHGDPGLSGESSALLTMSADREPYAGGPVEVSLNAAGMELSERRVVGFFLLSSTNGVRDTPADGGWTLLSDGAGGADNYVETHVLDADAGATITWSLRAPATEGSHTLFGVIQHGGDGVARLSTTASITIGVGPVPENLPQIAADWTPPTTRTIGEATELTVPAVNTTALTLEWRLGTDGPTQAIEAFQKEGLWVVTLPAALSELDVQYRFRMTNADFDERSTWVTLSAGEESYAGDMTALRLQMCGILFGTLALVIALQRRFGRTEAEETVIIHDMTNMVVGQLTQEKATLSMNDPRRPSNWSDEHWMYYGEEHIRSLEEGA